MTVQRPVGSAPAVLSGSPTVVVLGMMTKIPVAGVVWQVVHYLDGLRRLGYDVWYVEAHARTPSMFMERETDDGSARAAEFLARTLARFGFGDRWAYHALHDDGRVFGISRRDLSALYRRAGMILNLHGGTEPTDELTNTGRLVYLETDPVQLQIELHDGVMATRDFLDAHVAFFTFGENWGRVDNRLPAAHSYPFRPTRQPVVLDHWAGRGPGGSAFSSIANWRQRWREVHLLGEVFTWSKDLEFERVATLPGRTGATFELALSGHEPADVERLEGLGWHTRAALPMTLDLDVYRDYIVRSGAEFTVAKDQNVRLRSGWFSDRSATYLAAGRPVITQDTGVADIYPTGEGLHVWTDLDDAAAAVERVRSRGARESAAASEIAREYLAHDRVLGALMSDVGLSPRPQRHGAADAATADAGPWPHDLPLVGASRRPLLLEGDAEARILGAPVPRPLPTVAPPRPVVSVVVPVVDNLALTRLCLESLLHEPGARDLEVVVVDNGSIDGTAGYLVELASRQKNLVVLHEEANRGYPAAVNRGVAASRGDTLILLNNDTVLAPGWVSRLLAHLTPGVGLVGPMTDGAPGAARVPRTWRTFGEFLTAASARAQEHQGTSQDVDRLTYFCVALPRRVWDHVGALDEGFGAGMFEDDDHQVRLCDAGYRVVLAHDVLVAHFGEATLGTLAPGGGYGELFHANRERYENRHGAWAPHAAPEDPEYLALVDRLHELVQVHVPEGEGVVVISKGDPALVSLEGRTGQHFPSGPDGTWSGHHPADSPAAVIELERTAADGARFVLIPAPHTWWLQSYLGFRDHLDARYRTIAVDDAGLLFELVAT